MTVYASSKVRYTMETCVYAAAVVVILGLNLCLTKAACVNGDIANDTCVCFPGWMGEACDRCGGRMR